MKKNFITGTVVRVVTGTNHSNEVGYIEKVIESDFMEDPDYRVRFPDGSISTFSERTLRGEPTNKAFMEAASQ